jgi:hypothetical protein
MQPLNPSTGRKLNEFAASSMYHDDNWADKQQFGFTRCVAAARPSLMGACDM